MLPPLLWIQQAMHLVPLSFQGVPNEILLQLLQLGSNHIMLAMTLEQDCLNMPQGWQKARTGSEMELCNAHHGIAHLEPRAIIPHLMPWQQLKSKKVAML